MNKITMWINLGGNHNKDLYRLYQVLGKRAFHQYIKACMRFITQGRIGNIPIFSNFILDNETEVPKRIMISFSDEDIVTLLSSISKDDMEIFVKDSIRCCLGTNAIKNLLTNESEVKVIDLKALTRRKKQVKRTLTPAQQIKMRLAREAKYSEIEEAENKPLQNKVIVTQTVEDLAPSKASEIPFSGREMPIYTGIPKPISEPVLFTNKETVNNVDIPYDNSPKEESSDDDIFDMLEGLID